MVGGKRAAASVVIDEGAQAEIKRRQQQREGRVLRIARAQLRFANASEVARRPNDARWFCLQVSGGFDFTVEKLLSDAGVEVLVPREKYLAVRRRERVECERPTFSGYILVHLVPSAEAFAGLREQKNVVGLVGGRNGYIFVPPSEVKRFQQIKPGDMAALPIDRTIRDGSNATISAGPFAGFRCKVMAVKWSREARAKVRIDVDGNVFEIGSLPLAFLEKL